MSEYREGCNLYKKGKHGGFDLPQERQRRKKNKKFFLEAKWIKPMSFENKEWFKLGRYEKCKDMAQAFNSEVSKGFKFLEFRIPEMFEKCQKETTP